MRTCRAGTEFAGSSAPSRIRRGSAAPPRPRRRLNASGMLAVHLLDRGLTATICSHRGCHEAPSQRVCGVFGTVRYLGGALTAGGQIGTVSSRATRDPIGYPPYGGRGISKRRRPLRKTKLRVASECPVGMAPSMLAPGDGFAPAAAT